MARAKLVAGDVGSAELAELRAQFNNLLVVLENVASEVDAGNITADEAFTALLTAVQNGKDEDITGIDSGGNNYSGSTAEVAGVRSPAPHPRRPSNQNLVDLNAKNTY